MEVEGNRTTRNTSKPAQTADGTDMGQTDRHTDIQRDREIGSMEPHNLLLYDANMYIYDFVLDYWVPSQITSINTPLLGLRHIVFEKFPFSGENVFRYVLNLR